MASYRGSRNYTATRNMNRRVTGRTFTDSKPNRNYTNKNGDNSKREFKKAEINLQYLLRLDGKDDEEVLFTLINDKDSVIDAMSSSKVDDDIMCHLLILIGKAIQSPQQKNVRLLTHTALTSQKILINVQRYILNLQKSNGSGLKIESLYHFVSFLQKFQAIQPSNCSDIFPIFLPLIKNTVDKLDSPKIREIKDMLIQIEEDNTKFVARHTVNEQLKMAKCEMQHTLQPNENFRELSILPVNADISEIAPFLRPNIVQGNYSDVEHYLDVQFRLLREDYICPLRNGINDYLTLSPKDRQRHDILKNIQDIRIYQEFRILYPIMCENTVVHVASFDNSNLRHINWEHNKRFITGSLICFSDNDFKTMYFASIAKREVDLLEAGQVIIQFEKITIDVINLDASRAFVMVETQAYFEAYRHNLKALQEMNQDNIPMQQYIISVENVVNPPSYLTNLTSFDMISMVENCSKAYSTYHHIPVLQNERWPSKEDLGLDASQYDALRSAVTKEFSIIQGPPGTGKTFIGLKIAQLLLRNKHHCTSTPIFVICYTNHALDQFLEGILSYTNNIARVGGRCSSDILQPYQLNELRTKKRFEKCKPYYIRRNIAIKYQELNELGLYISSFSNTLKNSITKIACDQILQQYINPKHFYSLIKGATAKKGSAIYKWLRVDTVQVPDDDVGVKKVKTTEGCDDIDLIEAMREVDIDPNMKIFLRNEEQTNEWTVAKNKKSRKYIEKKLQRTQPMDAKKVNTITDVWALSIDERWSLYMYWQHLHIRNAQNYILMKQQRLCRLYDELQEVRNEENLSILRNCDVVGMTTTGAAKYRDIVERLKPEIFIFEEAAEILEAHIVTSLTKNTKHVILIGDHKQLRPNPTVYQLTKKFNFDVSLFERMITNGIPYHQLKIQHRMRPDIAKLLVPHIYPNLDNHESVLKYGNIKGVSANVFFINHDHCESENVDLKSHVNVYEAEFIAALCRYLLKQGYESSQITILTTYSGQYFVLKKLMNEPEPSGVRVTIVDNFQGEENDIILLSFVRSNEDGKIGFLKTANRVCVALSRARKGLYCIGNFTLFAKQSELWENICETLKSQNSIGHLLRLNCQNHPETFTAVKTAKDFENVPDGGCMVPCDIRLDCGHVCRMKCHPTDLDHELYLCRERCLKMLCKNGHKCPDFCFEQCKLCVVPVERTIPKCGHVVKLPCHVTPENYSCPMSCEKFLICSHPCPNKCGQKCMVKCNELVTKMAICGHKVSIKCHLSHDLDAVRKSCTIPCEKELSCGHPYIGPCGLDVPLCKENCPQLLPCGHKCTGVCSMPCEPCSETFTETFPCGHEVMYPCGQKPESCQHPCQEILPCGHMCTGSCSTCGTSHRVCEQMIPHSFRCGHITTIMCHEKDIAVCHAMCERKLTCGHRCCDECYARCYNGNCTVVVTRRKSCGHLQSEYCNSVYVIAKCDACLYPKEHRFGRQLERFSYDSDSDYDYDYYGYDYD